MYYFLKVHVNLQLSQNKKLSKMWVSRPKNGSLGKSVLKDKGVRECHQKSKVREMEKESFLANQRKRGRSGAEENQQCRNFRKLR